MIRIRGVEMLHSTNYSIVPDMIEAGTYMFAAAATRGDILIKNIIPETSGSDYSQIRRNRM